MTSTKPKTKTTNKTSRDRGHEKKRLHSLFGNMPTSLSTFIGREHEIDKVKKLILAHRLITLTGAGGSGKTRLALKAAQEVTNKFKHGVWFVDLDSLENALLIPDKIASNLNIREQSGASSLASLAAYLSTRQLCIILDNCEHLIKACAEMVEFLLQKCPDLHILTTSRELLGISSEVNWLVTPLTLPAPHAVNLQEALKQSRASESVQLFIERASAKKADFSLTVNNCESIAEICRRLDGMPLAIELAAAQATSLSMEELAKRLDKRFQFLTGGSRNAPLRQRTLIAAIDWSYALLTTKEQILLQRLSIFAGGATIEAAEAICSDGEIESAEVLERIAHLVDKSLVTADMPKRGMTRYRLLETIREYALAKLADSQERVDVRNKHLAYFIRFAEEAEQKIKGAEGVIWYERLEDEHDNTRVALGWALESKNAEAGLRLAGSLGYFWFVHGHMLEGIGWLEKFLKQSESVSPASEAKALTYLGTLVRINIKDDVEESILLHEKSLSFYRELDDRSGTAWVLNQLGVIALEKGELTKAEQLLNESLFLRKEIGDPWSIAQTLQNFAPIALQKNNREKAKEYAEETLYWSRRAGSQRDIARALTDLAEIARLDGNTTYAAILLTQALPQLVELGDRWSVAFVLESLAVLAAEQGKYKRAAFLFGAAEGLREEIGVSYQELEYKDYQQALIMIQNNLGESKFNYSWTDGRGMPLEQIVEYAVQKTELHTVKPDNTGEKVWFQLSPRERDVMRLLAEGHTNLEISQKLFLSEKTVRNRVSNIYQKLQITNRGEAILLARKLILTIDL